MKHLLLLLTLLNLTLMGAWARADGECWSDATLSTARSWNDNQALFSDTFASTIWGALKSESHDLSDEEARQSTVYLRTSFYGKKQPAYLVTQKQGHSPFTRNAPLMVIIPGIFVPALDSYSVAEALRFYQQGYHVLILSNPWSVNALKHDPYYKPGNIEKEGEAVLASIQTAIQKEIGYRYVSSVSLYGESYGAMLAAVAAGLDDDANPTLTGKVMVASPPLKMTDSYQRLDQIYTESSATRDYCKSKRIRIGLNFLKAKGEWNLNSDSRECSKALVASNFTDLLGQSMKQIEKSNLEIPRDEPYEVSFDYYAHHFAPEMNDYCLQNAHHCDLSYWLGQAVKKGKLSINVIASQDDFLNQTSDWDEIPKVIPDPSHHLILLNWGGHLGYLGSRPYSDEFFQN
jgi:predicted alpha/beta-fold hydrolase